MKILKIIGPMAIIAALIIISPEANSPDSDSLLSLDKLENIASAQSEGGCMTWCWGQYVPCDDASCESDCDQTSAPAGPGSNMVENYEYYRPPEFGPQPYGPREGCYVPSQPCCYYTCTAPPVCA